MKKLLGLLIVAGVLGWLPIVSDAATATTMFRGFKCGLASAGTGCLGDMPQASGVTWNTGIETRDTTRALVTGDYAQVEIDGTPEVCFYVYDSTATAAEGTGDCPTVVKSYAASWSAGEWKKVEINASLASTVVKAGTATGGVILGDSTPDTAGELGYATGQLVFHDGTSARNVAKAGTLTNLKWCSSDGTVVNCTENAPAGTGDVTAASSFGSDNLLIKSDGTGKGVQATGITVDDDNNITGVKSLTTTKTSGTAGLNCVYEANSTDTSQVCWQGPDNRSADLKLKFPDADPATSILVCGAPSATVSTCAWYAMDTDLSSVSTSDDTVPSAKAVKAVTDARLSTTAPAAIDGSSGTGPTAAQMADPRCQVSNYGQAASDVAVALPTVAENLSCLFVVGTAQTNKWGVQAAANDKIYLLAADGTISAGSDNGYARMTNAQVGQSFACWSFKTGSSAYDWQCKAIAIGTSTFAAN